jgi:hypothetical protein
MGTLGQDGKRKERCPCPGRVKNHPASPGEGQPDEPASSTHPGRSKLQAHPRPVGPGDFRNGMLPRALTASAHDEEVAPSKLEALGRTTSLGSQEEGTRRAERNDGDHGVLSPATADSVAMPRHAVAPIPIEAAPDRAERFPQFRLEVRAQRSPDGVESRIRRRLIRTVERDQSRHVERAGIHPTALGLPGNGFQQPLEQLVRSAYPPAMELEPRVARQEGTAFTRGHRRERER